MSPREAAGVQRFWINLGIAFVVVLLFMVWEHVEANRLRSKNKDLRREADRLTYENGLMQTQIHRWTSPTHLDQIARQQHHMAPLDSKQVIGLETP